MCKPWVGKRLWGSYLPSPTQAMGECVLRSVGGTEHVHVDDMKETIIYLAGQGVRYSLHVAFSF